MAFANEDPYSTRQRDDETQAYLMNFFREQAAKPGFADAFAGLTEKEQEKLRSMSG